MGRSLAFVTALTLCSLSAQSAHGQAHFRRGDVNRDLAIDLSDGIGTLTYLFLGGTTPPCLDAADFDDDGDLNIGDAVSTFNFLFLGGNNPKEPYNHIDADPSADTLDCLGAPVVVTGDITADTTWSRDKSYLLKGGVFVRAPATLTIQPGTTIFGEKATTGVLVIDRGAKIKAVGSADDPIIFTSDQPVGSRARKDWGGVVVLGRGETNNVDAQGVSTNEGIVEGFAAEIEYGGGVSADNNESSGQIKYVRIEYCGIAIAPNSEVNGLSLYAVGAGTEIDHVMVKYSSDDCLEFFGGAAHVKHILCVGIADDNFDYSFSWRGKAQFIMVQQHDDEADKGFEVDNHETAFGNLPLTNPLISNFTLIGNPTSTADLTKSAAGMNIRRGAASRIYNGIVQGFRVVGLDIDDAATTAHSPEAGDLVLDYTIFSQNGSDGTKHFITGETGTSEESVANGFAYTTVDFGRTKNPNNTETTNSQCVDPYNLENPNFRPQNEALTPGKDPQSLDSFFEPAAYRGAVAPTGDDWTQKPWISYLRK